MLNLEEARALAYAPVTGSAESDALAAWVLALCDEVERLRAAAKHLDYPEWPDPGALAANLSAEQPRSISAAPASPPRTQDWPA